MKKTTHIYILRYLTVLLTGAVLAGCGKTTLDDNGGEDVWDPLTGDTPVRIRTSISAPETKVTGTAFESGEQIGIFGFYHNGNASTDGSWAAETAAGTNIPDYMYNQLMTYNAGTGVWDYSPIKYWPNETSTDGNGAASAHIDKLSFWGYYPYGGSEIGINLRASGSSDPYDNESYGLPDIYFVANGYADLMTSDLVQDAYKGDAANHGALTDGEVELDFHHRLAQITIKAQKDPEEKGLIKIHRMELRNIRSDGTYSSVWALGDDEQDYTVYSSDGGILVANAPSPTFIGTQYLLPQTMEADTQRLYVEFSINSITEIHTEELDLVSAGTVAWEMNKQYVYTITIKPNVSLTLDIQPWEYHERIFSGAIIPHIAWSGSRLEVDKDNGWIFMDNWAPAHCEFFFSTGDQYMATIVGDGNFTFCLEDGTALVDSTPLPDGSGNVDVWKTTITGDLSYNVADDSPIPVHLYVKVTDYTTVLMHEALLRFYLRSREGDWQLVRMTTTAEDWGASVYECKLIQNYK